MEQQNSINLSQEQREEILNSFNPVMKLLLKNLPDNILDILLDGHIKGIENINELTASINTIIKQTKQRTKLSEYGIPDGLWPMDKEITEERGLDELENLGYKLFYKGKNADAYIILGTNPIELLLYRTDRTSVFDIPLDLEIEGKGEIQNQQGLIGVEFAKSRGIEVANRELPDNIPSELKSRYQAVELCKPLTIEIDGKEKGLELILRNELTGSLNRAYQQGEDPYGLNLSSGLKEWHHFDEPIFTPTTKEKNDMPIKASLVREKYPEIIEKLTQLLKDFTAFALEKGYVVVDTKFEVFINSKGEWCLGDEILTPESSRFIKIENYKQGKYISEDKEIVRQLGIEFKWRERFEELKKQDPKAKMLSVKDDISPEDEEQILGAYVGVFNALSNDLKYINTNKGTFKVLIKTLSDGYLEAWLEEDKNVRILAKEEKEGLTELINIVNNPPENYLAMSPFLRDLHGIKATNEVSNGIWE